jgi:hypothetical protein
MNTDRRAILSLIAMGRISPRDAERLLAVPPDGDEFILRAAVCLAVIWLVFSDLGELLTGLAHVFISWFPGISLTAHHALACLAQRFGGLL